jgi:hypothetical protein
MRYMTTTHIALLSLATLAAPVAAQQTYAVRTSAAVTTSAAPQAGVYRLQMTEQSGRTVMVRLIVERIGERLSGTLVSEDNVVAHADLRVVDDALRASTATSLGEGTLLIRETDSGITGTFTVGKKVWKVEGERSV